MMSGSQLVVEAIVQSVTEAYILAQNVALLNQSMLLSTYLANSAFLTVLLVSLQQMSTPVMDVLIHALSADWPKIFV